MLREIRLHGRGGQGAVTAAELIAKAAFYEGKWSQAFPFFGAERRGAPVRAFARIDDKPIRLRSQIYRPDYVIVLDPFFIEEESLLRQVLSGLKEDGMIIANAKSVRDDAPLLKYRLAIVDATEIALQIGLIIAGIPVVNTAMVGAFAKATGEVKLESVMKAVENTWSGKPAELNKKAVERAFHETRILKT